MKSSTKHSELREASTKKGLCIGAEDSAKFKAQVRHAHKKWERLFFKLARKFIRNPLGAPVREKNGFPFRDEALLSPVCQEALRVHKAYVARMEALLQQMKTEAELIASVSKTTD